jgi:hypothetical protein
LDHWDHQYRNCAVAQKKEYGPVRNKNGYPADS